VKQYLHFVHNRLEAHSRATPKGVPKKQKHLRHRRDQDESGNLVD